MIGNALNRAAQQEIRNKRQQNCNHRRLGRVERLEHRPLINGVHHDAKNDDPRRRDDSFPETSTPSLRVADAMDERPQIWPTPDSGVMYAVPQRGDNRHRGLQNEAKRHRTARPIENVAPKTTKAFLGDPVPRHSEDDERKQDRDSEARLQQLAFGYRLCHVSQTRPREVIRGQRFAGANEASARSAYRLTATREPGVGELGAPVEYQRCYRLICFRAGDQPRCFLGSPCRPHRYPTRARSPP